MGNSWLRNIHNMLLPGCCLLCGGRTGTSRDLCHDCVQDLPSAAVTCQSCGVPLTGLGGICGVCQKDPPHYDKVVSPLLYASPVDRMIQRFKYHNGLHYGRVLSGLLYDAVVAEQRSLPALVLPVPLHNSRLRERGYNQALELARPLARRLSVALDRRSIRRIRKTEPQQSLNAQQRKKNLQGAFVLDDDFKARHVAIVDDVMTTGQTANILAKLLKARGAQTVEVWVAARASLE
jgi:ComF family protein